MSIECKPSVSAMAAPAAAAASGTAATGRADDASAAGASGAGFLSLLMGLGDAPAVATAVDTALTSSSVTSSVADPLAHDPDTPATADPANMQLMLAQMLGLSGQAAPPVVAGDVPVMTAVPATPLDDGTGSNGKALPVTTHPGGARGVAHRDGAAPDAATSDVSSHSSTVLTSAQRHGAALQAHQQSLAQARAAAGADAQSGGNLIASAAVSADAGRGSRDALPGAAPVAALAGQSNVNTIAASSADAGHTGSGDSRQQRHDGERPAGVEGNGNTVGNGTGTTYAVGTAGTSAAAASSVSPFADEVAQQIQYWITQDVQSAELQLDGLGTQPVQVNITVSGNEAQVVFRSDQAQTRELLGSAMVQLDQMMQSQGLSLSGGWVGGSGGQSPSPDNPQNARSGTVRALVGASAGVSAAVHGAAPTGGSSSSGLDCFA